MATHQMVSSQSDNSINIRRAQSLIQDAHDGVELNNIPRSQSLQNMDKVYYTNGEFSEDDHDDQFNLDIGIEAFKEESQLYGDENITGAARSREAPKRKTKNNRKSATRNIQSNLPLATTSKNAVYNPLRARRKIRDPTPDIEVDVE